MIDFALSYCVGFLAFSCITAYIEALDSKDTAIEIGVKSLVVGIFWPLIGILLMIWGAVNIFVIIGLPFAGIAWLTRYVSAKFSESKD